MILHADPMKAVPGDAGMFRDARLKGQGIYDLRFSIYDAAAMRGRRSIGTPLNEMEKAGEHQWMADLRRHRKSYIVNRKSPPVVSNTTKESVPSLTDTIWH